MGLEDEGREGGLVTPGEHRGSAVVKFELLKLEAKTALPTFWHVEPKTQMPIKTFGPHHAQLRYSDGDEDIGRLDDITVTLMRLKNPNTGAVSIQMSLEYLATSNGSRTPDGRTLPGSTSSLYGREAYRLKHWIYFRTAAGGLVHDWYVGQDFELDCGWNRRHCLHGRIETNILDWFDAVERYEWEIRGLFYHC
jgi:hypothetical protein